MLAASAGASDMARRDRDRVLLFAATHRADITKIPRGPGQLATLFQHLHDT